MWHCYREDQHTQYDASGLRNQQLWSSGILHQWAWHLLGDKITEKMMHWKMTAWCRQKYTSKARHMSVEKHVSVNMKSDSRCHPKNQCTSACHIQNDRGIYILTPHTQMYNTHQPVDSLPWFYGWRYDVTVLLFQIWIWCKVIKKAVTYNVNENVAPTKLLGDIFACSKSV